MRVKLSVEEYRAELLAALPMVAGDPELVQLTAGLGRTLAAPLVSRTPIPAFTNSAMDGFALVSSDLVAGRRLEVVAQVMAGSALDPDFGAGQCVRIMTGAPLPTAADTVIPLEQVSQHGSTAITIDTPVKPGAHVRGVGEDCPAGVELAPAGTVLDAAWLSLAAGCGRGALAVAPRPRVAVISTGDELLGPEAELGRGQIHESNSLLLGLTLQGWGAQVSHRGIADDPDALAAALTELAVDQQLVVLSGGISVGDHDVSRITLETADRHGIRHVQMQPGKPQGWALWGGCLVVAFPGNPLSAAVSCELFARPLVDALLGRVTPEFVTARAEVGFASPPGRRQFLPVIESVVDSVVVVRPAHQRGSASHMVSAFARATGLAMVAAEVDRVEPGDQLSYRRLS